MDSKTARIRALNDELRQHLTGGTAVITPGVAALGSEAGSPSPGAFRASAVRGS